MWKRLRLETLWQGVLLIIVAALGITSYEFYQQLSKLTDDFHHQTAPLQNSIQALNQSQEALKNQLMQLQEKVNTLPTQAPTKTSLMEVQSLIWMAEDKLRFTQDIDTAQKMLETAQKRLALMNDPSLEGLKSALQNDIVLLQNAPKMDKEAIRLKLQALKKDIKELRFKSLFQSEQTPSKNHNYFNGLIKITHEGDNPIPASLSQEERAILLRQLEWTFDQMQWLWMQQLEAPFQENADWAKQALQQYFMQDTVSQNMVKDLETLQAIKFKQEVPEISASLQALQGALQ